MGRLLRQKLSWTNSQAVPKDFGFVEMSDNAAAQKAISELDNGTVDGRNIKVTEARPREERPARNGGGFRSDSGFIKKDGKYIEDLLLKRVFNF